MQPVTFDTVFSLIGEMCERSHATVMQDQMSDDDVNHLLVMDQAVRWLFQYAAIRPIRNTADARSVVDFMHRALHESNEGDTEDMDPGFVLVIQNLAKWATKRTEETPDNVVPLRLATCGL